MPKKLTLVYVNGEIEKVGYKLLSDIYVNARTKLKVKCNEEHIYFVTWDNFYHGNRCPKCKGKGSKNPFWRGGVEKLNLPRYDTLAYQIDWHEEVRRDPNNSDLLQVRCTGSNCRKWFTPTSKAVRNRIRSLLGTGTGACRFYCSDECKQKCSLFKQILYPRGLKKNYSRRDQQEWANMVKERDGYECQRCGSSKDLIAHHYEGIYVNPLESADVDMGITLCKKCNKKAHTPDGCRFVNLQKRYLCK